MMPDPDRRTISATESPALWNVSPYTTRWMIYQRFAKGVDLDSAPNSRMDWGSRMEPLLLQAASEDLHFETQPDRVYVRRGLLGCTRDAIIVDPQRGPGALECKCVFDYATWMREWGGGKTVPRHYEIQIQQQCYVGDGETPFEWGVIAAWCGAEMTYFRRDPIAKLWSELEREAGEFFAAVADKREPEPFGVPIEVPLLDELYPTVAGTVLDLRNDPAHVKTGEDVRMFVHHREARLGHERGYDLLRAKLLGVATEHESVLLPYGISYRVAKSGKGRTIKPYIPETPGAPPPSHEMSGALI